MIEADFLVESSGSSSSAVEDSLKRLVELIGEEENIEVVSSEVGEVESRESGYSCIAEMYLKFRDVDSYLRGIIKYPPSALMLHSPERVKLRGEDFQELVAKAGRVLRDFYTYHKAGFVFEDAVEKVEGVDEDEVPEHIEEGAIRVGVMLQSNGKSRDTILSRVTGTLSGNVDYIKAEEMSLEVGEVVAMDLLIYPPSSVFELVAKHMPMLIKVVEPEEINLSMLDLQEIGLTLAEVINEVVIQRAVSRG